MKKIMIVLLCFELLCSAVHAEMIVVSNKKGPPNKLTGLEIKNILFGKKKKWDNGKKIILVTMMKSQIHKDFVRKYSKKSAAEYKNYWKKMLFTGKGIPPKSFKNETDMLEYVIRTEGAISYISSMPDTDEVKIIEILDN